MKGSCRLSRFYQGDILLWYRASLSGATFEGAGLIIVAVRDNSSVDVVKLTR